MNKQLSLIRNLNATIIWACVVVVECTTHIATKVLFKSLRASATLKHYLVHPIEQGHHSKRYHSQFTEKVDRESQPPDHDAQGRDVDNSQATGQGPGCLPFRTGFAVSCCLITHS